MVAVLARQQEGNLVKRSVFGVCGVDASNQEELRPGRLAGGPRGPMKKEPMATNDCRLDEMEKVCVGQDDPATGAVILQKNPVSTNSS